MKSVFKFVVAVAVCAAFVTFPACNTTKGVGKDIEKAGTGLKNSANRNGAD